MNIAPGNEFNSFVIACGFIFSMASTFSSFGLILFSSISCPNHFVWFLKNDFLLLVWYPAFSSLFNPSNNFFSWSCLLPRVTTIMSSSQACVQHSNVRSFFFWILYGYRRVRKSLFESVIAIKLSHVSANTDCQLVSSDNFICLYA